MSWAMTSMKRYCKAVPNHNKGHISMEPLLAKRAAGRQTCLPATWVNRQSKKS